MILKRQWLKLLACVLISSLQSVGFSSDKKSDEAKTSIFWPITSQPKFGIRSFNRSFDGIDVPMVSIQIGKWEFELSRNYNQHFQASNSPRYSGEIHDKRFSDAPLRISQFTAKKFLPDLSEESWASYKKGLIERNPQIKVVLDNTNLDAPITPYVFGQKFRQIAYEIQASNQIVKRREIFTFLGDDLIVFSVSGTKENVDRHWTQVERLISEMTLIR